MLVEQPLLPRHWPPGPGYLHMKGPIVAGVGGVRVLGVLKLTNCLPHHLFTLKAVKTDQKEPP